MIEIKYFNKYTGKSNSIVDALKDVGVSNPSQNYRKNIAILNGIENYSYSAEQNMQLLNLLKKGKLIKSKTEVFRNREKFMGRLQTYNPVLKKYGKQIFYSFTNSEKSFSKAETLLKNGKKTGLTCVVPCRWALKDIGISPSSFYSINGSFAHCYKGDVKKHLTRISTGSAIGLTIKQAVNKNLLKVGDIITFKDSTHVFVYSGNKCFVYDGGHAANYPVDGILVDYTKKNASRKINDILRWKD